MGCDLMQTHFSAHCRACSRERASTTNGSDRNESHSRRYDREVSETRVMRTRTRRGGSQRGAFRSALSGHKGDSENWLVTNGEKSKRGRFRDKDISESQLDGKQTLP